MDVTSVDSVVSSDQISQAVSDGLLDFAVVRAADLVNFNPGFGVYGLPFLFADTQAVSAFQASSQAQQLLTSLADNNLVAPAYINNGFALYAGNSSILEPADLRNTKIRSRITTTEVDQAFYNALGISNITSVVFSEISPALFTGIIDGVDGNLQLYSALFQSEMAAQALDGITISNHFLDARVLIINADRWDSLQTTTRENLNSIVGEVNGEIEERDIAILDQLEAAGEPVRQLTDEQRTSWIQAAEPVILRFQDSIGTEIVTEALSL